MIEPEICVRIMAIGRLLMSMGVRARFDHSTQPDSLLDEVKDSIEGLAMVARELAKPRGTA